MRAKSFQLTDQSDAGIGDYLGERYREILLLRLKIADAERTLKGKCKSVNATINTPPTKKSNSLC